MNNTRRKRILISWVGLTDLGASESGTDSATGPIAQVVEQRDFDLIVLLSNSPKRKSAQFVTWLERFTDASIELHPVELSHPMHFGQIYEAATSNISKILREYGDQTRLTYHISPGTSAMAAVWIIIAKTRYAAELMQSSVEAGVTTATVPFDISAEFIPELLKRPDENLSNLSLGIPEASAEFADIIHQSPEMKRVIAKAQKIAPRSVPVLIEGESGTGKELMARAIHKASLRKSGPFIAVNCGAISPELIESEFFGHAKGAFTGAMDRKGHFEEANGGTLFLDEIGELPLKMQVKLLRALQEKKVVRVGASNEIPVDVRILAATNRNLASEVSAGNFREDLFYRIAVAILRLPPLRSRSGDLGLLINKLLEHINASSADEPGWVHKKISAGGRNLLINHTWPGNIRELQNTLTRATAWSASATIGREDIRDALMETPSPSKGNDTILNRSISDGIDLQGIISDVAKHYLERAMKESGDNKSKAAALLGLGSYQTLNNWMNKYGLDE